MTNTQFYRKADRRRKRRRKLLRRRLLIIKRLLILLTMTTILVIVVKHAPGFTGIIHVRDKKAANNITGINDKIINDNFTIDNFHETHENKANSELYDDAGNRVYDNTKAEPGIYDKEKSEYVEYNQYHLYDEKLQELPEQLLKLYEKNEDARAYVLGYWEKKDKEYVINLDEYKNCDDVPLLMQWDERWGYEIYSGNFFGLTGCGPTCLSMAAIYLTKDVSYTPEYMMNFSEDWGYSVTGSGSAWTLISQGPKKLGIKVKELSLSEDVMIDSLSDNSVIIAVLGPGDFTDSGHFIVIRDYQNGFIINDPNSYKNSQIKWSYDDLKWQIRGLWKLYI